MLYQKKSIDHPNNDNESKDVKSYAKDFRMKDCQLLGVDKIFTFYFNEMMPSNV